MNHVSELRNELCSMFNRLKDGKASIREATEMNNAAGKIMQSVKVQLEYARLREEKPVIDFIATQPEATLPEHKEVR